MPRRRRRCQQQCIGRDGKRLAYVVQRPTVRLRMEAVAAAAAAAATADC
jgi:hypothetical protein